MMQPLRRKDYPTGIIVYEGPSLIDGKPIVAIATGFRRTRNLKTGKMVGIWVLRSDIHPQDAIRTHEDFSICGDCKHRDFRSCYVNVLYGPISTWRSYKRGIYKQFTPDCLKYFKEKHMRIGSYGDPASIPFEVWDVLCRTAKGHTGYTHQWKSCDQRLKYLFMASVDSIEGYYNEYTEAQQLGWRTFRIRGSENEPVFENEIICPASSEYGKKTDCLHCGFCSGTNNRKCPVIVVHGWEHKVRYYREGMKKVKNHRKWRKTPRCSKFANLTT